METQQVRYQPLMRVIGRYFDSNNAVRVRILEVPTGFFVYHWTDLDSEVQAGREFTYAELSKEAGRLRLHAPHLRALPGIRGHPVKPTYQNFLRGLGFELEAAGAFSILLEELDDRFLLTYQYYAPEANYALHKRRVTLQTNEAGKIVSVAVKRRGRSTDQ